MTNSTIEKFGYPDSLIGELDNWVVLLRPKQITLGCLVLICKDDATSLGSISEESSREFQTVCSRIEAMLSKAFSPDKFNYLALMMVDPHAHFHVIPRFEGERLFNGKTVSDCGWPKHPNMNELIPFTDDDMDELVKTLRHNW